MRTLPADNFSLIYAEGDLVRVEIWKQFGEHPKWRVEKPGRVVVMDGASTTMLVRPDIVVKGPASSAAYDTYPLLELTNVQNLITHELRKALAKGWNLQVSHETTAAGEKKALVTVEAKAGVPDNDYAKNHWFDVSDMRRVYRFDAKTQRLEGLEAYLHQAGGDLLILKVEQIEYDKAVDPAVFTLQLPEKAREFKGPERLPNTPSRADDAPAGSADVFRGLRKRNWQEVEEFWTLTLDDSTKHYLGGMEIIRIGEPFQSKASPHWFIPYEIKFGDGVVRKHNLAMRKDNSANRYVCDGGL